MATFEMTVVPCDEHDIPIAGVAPQRARFVLQGGNPGLLLTNLDPLAWTFLTWGRLAHLRCMGEDGEMFSLPIPMRLTPYQTVTAEPGGLRLEVLQRYDPTTLSHRWL